MGGGTSKQIKCPNDYYDKEKFDLILKLYDYLDSNGDQVIESNELKDIAKLHISNRKNELIKSLNVRENEYNSEVYKTTVKYDKDVLDLGKSYHNNLKNIEDQYNKDQISINENIKKLSELTEKEKCEKFLKVVSNDGKHIEFWKFFEYMKNRTQDIKNIEFTA